MPKIFIKSNAKNTIVNRVQKIVQTTFAIRLNILILNLVSSCSSLGFTLHQIEMIQIIVCIDAAANSM